MKIIYLKFLLLIINHTLFITALEKGLDIYPAAKPTVRFQAQFPCSVADCGHVFKTKQGASRHLFRAHRTATTISKKITVSRMAGDGSGDHKDDAADDRRLSEYAKYPALLIQAQAKTRRDSHRRIHEIRIETEELAITEANAWLQQIFDEPSDRVLLAHLAASGRAPIAEPEPHKSPDGSPAGK